MDVVNITMTAVVWTACIVGYTEHLSAAYTHDIVNSNERPYSNVHDVLHTIMCASRRQYYDSSK